MKKIDARYLEMKLKKGWSTIDFCRDLGTSEDEFFTLLRKCFKERPLRYYLKRIQGNSKKIISGREDKKVKDKKVKIEQPKVNKVEELKAQEKELSDEIYKLEISLEEKRREKRTCKSKLQESQKLLEKFLRQLEGEKEKVQKSISRIDTLNSEIENLKKDIYETTEARGEVQYKIQELSTIIISYKDGKIICDCDDVPEEIEYNRFLQDLLQEAILEDLSLKELKQLAKILAYAEYCQETIGRRVAFDLGEEPNLSIALEFLQEEKGEQS